MTIDGKAMARRILVVEDEMLIALHLESMLEELGHEVVGLAARMDQGIALAHQNGVNFAILDINIAGSDSFPIFCGSAASHLFSPPHTTPTMWRTVMPT